MTARPGWLVNGRESIAFESARGLSRGLNLTSKLGEDHTCFPPPPTVKDEHETTFVLGASATPASQVEMYALPATSAAVSVSASPAIVEKGRHKVTKTWEAWTCRVCGARQEARTEVSHYDVEPEAYAWTATAAGETLASSTWSGLMSKGLGQTVSFSVTGTRSACASCTYTASTNALVDVHELSVSRDDYLGINRTDAGRADPVVKTATALIDPAPTGSAAYSWTDRGICSFTGRTDQATARYFAPDPDRASASLLAEPLTVEATVSKGGQTASATCTTNFTVVKVGVVANGVGEAKEETEGVFLQYVPDADGDISVEGTNKMVSVAFTCEPVLPPSEMVKVTYSGQGELYEELPSGVLVLITAMNYPACEIGSHVFKLHGHEVSSSLHSGKIVIKHLPSGATDIGSCTVRQFSFTVYVDQPGNGGDDDPIERGSPGHAFWQFTMNPLDAVPNGLSAFVNVPNGFYPADDVGIFNLNHDVPGLYASPDAQHANGVDVSKTWQISLQEFRAGVLNISLCEGCRDGSVMYNAITYNCVNAVVDVAGAAGIVLPANPGGSYMGITLGLTCGRFGEDIRNMK